MYDHIGLHVRDLEKSVRFYEAVLKSLGHVLCSHDATSAGLGPKDAPALWLYAGDNKASHAHIAFRAESRAVVERFHRDGLKTGGIDNGKPSLRADYSPTYYAAFLLDPDGNNVEAVCLAVD
jgi:catechol 2,3-dioxygenase-like lactoylglutathione lyase family enzyme